MSDPYNPFEEHQNLTMELLRLADRHRFGVVVITKSDLVCRDTDILAAIGTHSPAAVNITITAADDARAKQIEPHAPASTDRFRAIEKLSAEHILCGVILLPVLPFLTDTKENISAIVSRAADVGASFVYAEKNFAVSLRDRQRTYFYERLDEQFPGLRSRYEKTFGDQYWCGSPDLHLWDTFVQECEASGLIWRHDGIDALLAPWTTDVQSQLW